MESPPGQLIYTRNSAFHTIEVSQTDGLRLLRTDQHAVQSVLSLSHPEQLNLPYMHAMMAGLLFPPSAPQSILMLGLGGGDLVRYLHHYFPESMLTAIEIDAAIVDVCQEYFALPESKNIDIQVDDAMHFISNKSQHYEMIMVDIYHGANVPTVLHDKAFHQLCFDRLTENGMLILNLLTNDADIFKHILWMLREQFDRSTLCLSVPQHRNIVVFAFKQRPTDLRLEKLQEKAEELSKRYELNFSEWTTQLFSTNPTVDGELIFELAP